MTDIAKIRTGKVKGTMNSNNLSDYYYNHSFMERLRKRLPEILPNTYCIVAIDIEHFRLFNKLYGRSSGDEVIRYIYTCLKQSALEYDGIDAYLGGDNFVAFLPDDDEVLNNIRQKIIKKFSEWNNTSAFFPLFGVYTIKDTSVLPELMYDHAMLALSHAEEDYKWHICRYTIEMESSLEKEVYLLAAIEEGLEKGEFTFFAQPQCNIATGQIVGAEALVRWQKPDGEVLLPGGFIPVLEKNKMIDQLDRYVSGSKAGLTRAILLFRFRLMYHVLISMQWMFQSIFFPYLRSIRFRNISLRSRLQKVPIQRIITGYHMQ